MQIVIIIALTISVVLLLAKRDYGIVIAVLLAVLLWLLFKQFGIA